MPLPLPLSPREAPVGEVALRVLVADDIEESRTQLVALVRALGHDCMAAGSGRQALELTERHEPDLLLVDLLMPDLDGFEVVRQLRARETGRWLPVVVTSSLQGDAHFIEALSRGADDCLVRPVNPALLEAKLRHYRRVLVLQGRLAALAQWQRAIHEHIAAPVLTLDAQGVVCAASRAAVSLFAGPGAQATLTGLGLQACTGLDPTLVRDARAPREVQVRDAAGLWRPMALSSDVWSMAAQEFTTLALHDLSEQRLVERMKDEFLAGVSHELRTPLTSIMGALTLLDAGAAGPLPEAAGNLVAVARRNGDRLGRLIDDVLDLAKLESNHFALRLQPRGLEQLVAEAVSANGAYAARHGVQLRAELLAPVAPALVDVDRLLQVLANLLSNAVKHSPPQGTVAVTLSGVREGWRIDVRDQGPGIPEAFRARLFEKFAQADGSDRRATGGTGLGLYISRLLVEHMGGRIVAESPPGAGATFSVTLPMHEAGARWALCVARDHQRQQRLADWLAPVLPVELAGDMAAAEALVRRRGPPSLLLADPQGQGPADLFAAAVRALAPRSALAGDSLDAAFAGSLGLPWLALGGVGGREHLVAWVWQQLAPAAEQEQ